MEEKESLIKTIEEVNNDKEIITEWMREENARLKHAGEMRYARDEGIEKGIEQGIEQGLEQGISLKELELIKNMLKENTDYNYISKITGKTIEEIKEIENSMEE